MGSGRRARRRIPCRPGSAWFHLLPRILLTTVGRHRLERPKSSVGSADCRLLPAGSADGHLLPRILSTNSGTIHWSSRILRWCTPPSASRTPPLSGEAHPTRSRRPRTAPDSGKCISFACFVMRIRVLFGRAREGQETARPRCAAPMNRTAFLRRQQVEPGTARSERRPLERIPFPEPRRIRGSAYLLPVL